ncbi:hypothetical protein B0T22DRAFT_450958 [Podospora appendiculata]|uniref:Uncharacterized protein n=1 Tax=Podospora appendiculata TaxID=314037 RepID=A0AAE0XI30_9PEZI|nr:hypothetical protein B0T22DRAFT_450958 [Podospora appendiculata]
MCNIVLCCAVLAVLCCVVLDIIEPRLDKGREVSINHPLLQTRYIHNKAKKRDRRPKTREEEREKEKQCRKPWNLDTTSPIFFPARSATKSFLSFLLYQPGQDYLHSLRKTKAKPKKKKKEERARTHHGKKNPPKKNGKRREGIPTLAALPLHINNNHHHSLTHSLPPLTSPQEREDEYPSTLAKPYFSQPAESRTNTKSPVIVHQREGRKEKPPDSPFCHLLKIFVTHDRDRTRAQGSWQRVKSSPVGEL